MNGLVFISVYVGSTEHGRRYWPAVPRIGETMLVKIKGKIRTAEQFADQVCDAIYKAVKVRPNAIFRCECMALGRLVESGAMDRTRASEAMMKKFVFNVMAAAKSRKR